MCWGNRFGQHAVFSWSDNRCRVVPAPLWTGLTERGPQRAGDDMRGNRLSARDTQSEEASETPAHPLALFTSAPYVA